MIIRNPDYVILQHQKSQKIVNTVCITMKPKTIGKKINKLLKLIGQIILRLMKDIELSYG
jgi:uncharacterized protein YbcI